MLHRSQFFLVASQHNHLLNTYISTKDSLIDNTQSWMEENYFMKEKKSGILPPAAIGCITVFKSMNDKKAYMHF